MIGKYHLATIKPNIDKVGNVAFTADDVLFDWTAFEVPRGTCAVKSINIIIAGTNAVASSGGLDMDLFFATTVNGVAPPTLGDTNTAMNVISATAAKPYIIAYQGIDGSVMEDSGDGLVGYNVLGGGVTAEKYDNLIIEGDVNYTGTTAGYQTIWVAGVAQGAFDFGTGCDVAGAHSADDLTIVIDNVDADDVFAIGDTIIAFDADGSGETTIGDVTAVAADLITVDAAPNIIADDDEICNLNPIVIKLGLEY
mgnify:FL=1